jgi:SAM-dependent methyltransferase
MVRLGPGIRRALARQVLDIGSGEGSFAEAGCYHVVALDDNLDALLYAREREGGRQHRVFASCGRLYVAVPNGHGLCDAVYRFVFDGGGHAFYLGTRWVDRVFHSNLAVYGWALYFDRGGEAASEERGFIG